MKRLLLALCALALIAAESNLLRAECNNPNCRHCGNRRFGAQGCPPQGPFSGFFDNLLGGGTAGSRAMYAPAAPSPTVGYPYYTVRAPRDFLSANPRGIGP